MQLWITVYVGPWVSNLIAEETTLSKTILSQSLDVSGFDKICACIFGDKIAKQWDAPALGLPCCAGYTIGYQVVQAYLQRTGQTATEATFVPWREIIEASGFFALHFSIMGHGSWEAFSAPMTLGYNGSEKVSTRSTRNPGPCDRALTESHD